MIEESGKAFLPNVVILGMGFVGLTLAMALCKNGIKVLGIELDAKLVDSLNSGETSVVDPGISECLAASLQGNLFRAIRVEEHWYRSEKPITFIVTVGTPLRDGRVNNNSILNAVHQIGLKLFDEDLLVLRSTVAIGTSRNLVLPKLRAIERKVYLAMCPERTVEGNALEELRLLPQIIGGIDEASSARAKTFFEQICDKTIVLSTIESAEFLKLANNTYRDLMFGFANELTVLANEIDISSREIISAANLDYPRSRIAQPGPSGGPCLEKDPWILHESGLELGVDLKITSAARTINESSTYDFVANALKEFEDILSDNSVGLLGLSFKGIPPVCDTRGSFALDLIKRLEGEKYSFYGFEPAGRVSVENCVTTDSIAELLEKVEVLIICTNGESFSTLPQLINSSAKTPKLIIDMWGVLKNISKDHEWEYRSWG
jgi:UDP-N-acetyl-D-mannosaminuronic acid dehydrogenase